MTRRLVLSNESARHPLRRALPRPECSGKRRDDDRDGRLFVLSYVAFFICFYTLIF